MFVVGKMFQEEVVRRQHNHENVTWKYQLAESSKKTWPSGDKEEKNSLKTVSEI